jgi:RNA polymerase sigma factor (TIGR02999 family)
MRDSPCVAGQQDIPSWRDWTRPTLHHTERRETGSRLAAPQEVFLQHDDHPGSVTRLLENLQRGDNVALDQLFPLLYEELRRLAHRHRSRWQGDYTLGTTALVHEAYLKLVERGQVGAKDRAHFLAVAAKAMRHILCNYVRDRGRKKRGGGLQRLSLDEADAVPVLDVLSDEQADTIAALDAALDDLARFDPRLSRVVECRFFGGMSIPDTAVALRISQATVKRDFALARAWLYRELLPQHGKA